MKFFLRLASLILWFWAIGFTIGGVSVIIQNNFNIVAILFFVVTIGLFVYFGIYLWKKSMKYNRSDNLVETAAERFERESEIPGSKARQQKLNADTCIQVKHMAGLPIAEGAEIFVYRCENKVIFERNQDTIELDILKVRDILIKTDVEIQKSYVSSTGGAVGGYVLFGALGAMIGGRAKEKTSTIIEKYLIFAYEKGNELDYISMEVTNEPNALLFNTNYYELSKNERRMTSL
ncbi:hypothetical protein ACIQXI_09955 [Lysinibacillus sp. NPDC097195]|uniref:hypothetical protein n=1 Tax=Lysinibacillus sp. NPDC097195 TaxID=3364141 RepID=UPI00380525F7